MLEVLRQQIPVREMKWRRGAEFSDALRCVPRQAHEWSQPTFIASIVVDKVFGQIEADLAEKAMLGHRAPAWAIGSLLWDLVDHRAPFYCGTTSSLHPPPL